MNKYEYLARDEAGRSYSGIMDAHDVGEVESSLAERSLSLQSIKLVGAEAPASSDGDASIVIADVLERAKQLVPAIEAAAMDVESPRIRHRLQRTASVLRKGESMEDLIRSPSSLGVVTLVLKNATGRDASNSVGDWLAESIQQFESQKKAMKLLLYPLLTMLICALLFYALAVIVVPIFEEMYNEFEYSVPVFTRWVILFSEQLRLYGLFYFAGLAIGLFLVVGIARYVVRRGIPLRLFGAFASGTSGNLIAMHRFVSALASLIRLKLPADQSLRHAGRFCGHPVYHSAASQLADHMARSTQEASWAASAALPRLVTTALFVHTDDQSRADMLDQVAAVYLARANSRISWLLMFLPAIASIMVGIAVAFVVIALFAPLFVLVSQLAG